MFMFSVKGYKMKMLYVPDIIATVNPGPSQWFNGYDKRYFENLGWVDRRMFGSVLGFIYLSYWIIFRRSVYRESAIPVWEAFKAALKGYCSKR